MKLPELPSGNVQYAAGYYRQRAFWVLLGANVASLLLPVVGPFLRRSDAKGELTLHDGVAAFLLVIVGLTLPCVSCFIFYAGKENWKRLREEKIYAFSGRALLVCVVLAASCAVVSLSYSIIFADFEKKIALSEDPLRPADLSLGSRLLLPFTTVSVFLVLAFLFHLMPVNPYAGLEGEGKKATEQREDVT